MKWMKALLGMFALILMVGSISASPVELTLFPDRASACPTNTAFYELGIENIGPVEDTYDIASSSPEEITIAPSTLTIESGETFKDPFVWYTPKTTTKPGDYMFTIYATSRTTGERFSIDGRIEVLACHDLDIQQLDTQLFACVDELSEVEFEISNEGRDVEKVVLNTDFGTLSVRELELEPGTSQVVRVEFTDGQVGSREIFVDAKSTSSFAQATKLLEVNVQQCYASTLQVSPDNKEICEDRDGEVSVILDNTGTRQDTFDLRASGGELSDSHVTLEAGERLETTLSFTPNTQEAFHLNVVAEGRSTSIDTFTITGVNCRDVTIIVTPSSRSICENEDANYDVTLKNTGGVEDTYTVASNIGSLGETKVNLRSDGDEVIDLEVDGQKLEVGKHLIKVKAKSTSDSGVSDSSEVEIEVLNCYDLNMNVRADSESIGAGNKILFENELKNTGLRDNVYNLEVEGPPWVTLQPREAAIESGETKKTFIHAAAPFDVSGDFNIVVNAKDESGTVRKFESFNIRVGEDGDIDVTLPPTQKTLKEELSYFWNWLTSSVRDVEAPIGLIASVIIGVLVVGFIVWRETK